VVDEKQGVRYARDYEHIVIDTPTRPTPEDLKTSGGDNEAKAVVL
jgi:chromosome partitioning protein